jgi:hypothetical protein
LVGRRRSNSVSASKTRGKAIDWRELSDIAAGDLWAIRLISSKRAFVEEPLYIILFPKSIIASNYVEFIENTNELPLPWYFDLGCG